MRDSPVILEPRYVFAYTVYYGLAAVWGLFATRNGIVLIYEVGGAGYEAVFTFLLAGVSGVLSFLTVTDAQRVEKWVTLVWLALVIAIPVAALLEWAGGDVSRAGGVASSVIYLVFPFVRYVYLERRTKRPRNG